MTRQTTGTDHATTESATNRRQFITSTTAAVGGVSLASGLSFARAAHPGGNEELKIALIGCGGRGTQAAAQALMADPQNRLWAIADAFEYRWDYCLNNMKRELKKAAGDDAEGVLNRIDVPQERRFAGLTAYQDAIDSGVDVVILTTPPGFRPLQFEAAVAAGKHVFMEKPVAVDGPGIRRVLAANEQAKAKGLKVGVGLQRHHQASYQATLEKIKEGAIGDVLATRVYWNGGGVWTRTRADLAKRLGREPTEMEYQVNNWYYFNWLCGDHIVEQHIHNLDVGNWIKGMHPEKANGMGGRELRTSNEHGQIFDHHAVEYTYPDGSVMISQCRHQPGCWSIVDEFAHGTKGSSRMNGGPLQINGDSEPWKFSGQSYRGGPYQREHDVLFKAIRNDETHNEGENGAYSTMTAILGRMATYSGKVITWDEAINSSLDLSPAELSFSATPPVVPASDGSYPVPVPGKTKVV